MCRKLIKAGQKRVGKFVNDKFFIDESLLFFRETDEDLFIALRHMNAGGRTIL